MCTTHGERRLISIRCHKESFESKSDGQTDSHSDYSAFLWVMQNFDTKYLKIEPRHEISNNVVCVTSKASDQPAHTRSLIIAFACRLNIL